MIVLARESRRLRQQELAPRIGVSQGTLSKIEKHELLVNDDTLRKISKALKYSQSFFCQSGGPVSTVLSYRRREKVPQSLITYIDAIVNLRRIAVQMFLTEMEVPPASVPLIPVSNKSNPREIARQIRKQWGVPRGPVENLTELLEKIKIVVLTLNFETENLLSRTILTENNHPIIVFNESLLGDQLRFTLAYELGHLIMHAFCEVDPNREIIQEANHFASEFLMPEKDIVRDLKELETLKKVDVIIPVLGKLKRKWGASMQAILFRANDLGIIPDNRKNFIIGQFKKMGIKKREPKEFDLTLELPKYFSKIISDYKKLRHLSDQDLMKKLGLSEDDFNRLAP